MFRLRFFDRGKRSEEVRRGVEISEHSMDLAKRLDDRFQDENCIGDEELEFSFLVYGGTVRIERCHSEKRGYYADVELRGGTYSIIELLAKKTDLPYAPNEVEGV